VRSEWLLPLKLASRHKQESKLVDWVGTEKPALGTDHLLLVSSSSTLKAEPKPVPMHHDPSFLLSPISSTCRPLHKPSCSYAIARAGLSCCSHQHQQALLTPQHIRKQVSHPAQVSGKSWTTWRTSPFPISLLVNLPRSRAELKPQESPVTPSWLVRAAHASQEPCSGMLLLLPSCQAAFPSGSTGQGSSS